VGNLASWGYNHAISWSILSLIISYKGENANRGLILSSNDDREWEEDIDSTIYVPAEDEEEWIPTFKQRSIAGFVIGLLFILGSLIFREVSFAVALTGASILIVLTILLGEKFVKFLTFIFQYGW
jgi:hypothetical protein